MRCWNCQKVETVEASDGFHQFWVCPECGATYTEVPKLGPPVVSIERSPLLRGEPTYKPRSQRRKGISSKQMRNHWKAHWEVKHD